MKIIFHTYCFVFFSFLAFSSCKSQPVVTIKSDHAKQVIVDAVTYEIIRDSVYCNAINDYYPFEFLKVEYNDKKVQDSINKFIIDLDNYTRGSEFNEELSGVYDLKNIIYNTCIKSTDTTGWDYIDTEYEVIVNEKHLFGFKYSWIVSGFAHYNLEHYNFNLKTGRNFTQEDVFNKNIQKLLDDLTHALLNEINSDLDSILSDDYSEEEKKYKKERFSIYLNKKEHVFNDLPQWVLTKNNNTLGIEFQLRYDMMAGYNHGYYIPVFRSIKELKPYLCNEFKTLIGLN